MKKALFLTLFLSFAFSVFAADKERRVVFDFTQPNTLVPYVEPIEPLSYGQVTVDDSVFCAGSIKISFVNPGKGGAKIEDIGSGLSVLTLYRSQYIYFSSGNDMLREIRFYGRQKGDIGIDNDTYDTPEVDKGSYEFLPEYSHWTNNGLSLQNAYLHNTGQTSMLDSIVVYYVMKDNKLCLNKSSIADSTECKYFNKLDLVYTDNISVKENTFQLVSEDGIKQNLVYRRSGNSLTLGTDTTVTKPGTYTLIVPANTIKSTDGELVNEEYKVTFTILEPDPEIDPVDPGVTPIEPDDPDEPIIADGVIVDYALSLEDGTELGYLDQITVTFNTENKVTVAPEPLIVLTSKSGKNYKVKSVVADKEKPNTFTINFINVESGEYSMVVPTGAFLCKEEMIQGFKANYKAVFSHEFNQNFKKPSSMYYQIAGTNDTKDKYYTEDLNDIIFFDLDWLTTGVVINKDVEVNLLSRWQGDVIAKGHFVEDFYIESHESNDGIVENKIPAARLKLDRELHDGDIKTDMGIGNEGYDYKIVINSGAIGDSNYGKFLADPNSVKKEDCSVNEEDVFLFPTIYPRKSEPAPIDPVDPVDPDEPKPFHADYAFDKPGEVYYLDNITLTFPNNKNVVYNEGVVVYLVAADGSKITAKEVAPTSAEKNAYKIAFVNVMKGEYDLNIPLGAFTIGEDKVQEITAHYSVQASPEPKKDLVTKWETTFVGGQLNEVRSEDLNNLVIYSRDYTLGNVNIISSGTVSLNSAEGSVIATGTLTAEAIDIEGVKVAAFRVNFNKSFAEGELAPNDEPAKYSLVIPQGIICDNTYNSYLTDQTNVSITDGNINKKAELSIDVLPKKPFVAKYEFSEEGKISYLDEIIITFPEQSAVEYNAQSAITLVAADGKTISSISVEATDKANAYSIRFINIEKGSYTLKVPLGAFTCGKDIVQAIETTYDVEYSPEFKTNLVGTLRALVSETVDSEMQRHAVDLNNIVLYSEEFEGKEVCVVADKRVQLLDEDGKVISTGQLVSTSMPVGEGDNTTYVPAFRLVFDRVFRNGDVLDSKGVGNDGCAYKIVVPEGIIGDKNYFNYLTNPASTSKADCSINEQFGFDINIFPEIPTAINSVSSSAAKATGTFDLSGRGVKTIRTSGVYIVDGKKMYVK